MRAPCCAALVLALAPLAGAQPQPEPKDGRLVFPLSAEGRAPPRPALKYALLPEVRDLNPGNQIAAFYKCFMEQHNLYHNRAVLDERAKWLAAPLADLKGEKALANYGGASVRQAHFAARLDTVDWGLTAQLKIEGAFLLLPDVQQLRELAQVLRLKLRGEIARGEFDAALRTAQTLLALARAFEAHPTLIGQLVGVAVATFAFDALDEFVQQPGAPNLFWALADLPHPFIGLKKGTEGERAWLTRDFDALRAPEPLPAAGLKALAAKLDPLVQFEPRGGGRETAWDEYRALAADAKHLAAARARLAAHGFEPARAERLDPVQAVMADDLFEYEVYRDDLLKYTNLPYWQVPAGLAGAKREAGVFGALAPSLARVKQAQVRLQQRIDMLRAVEALRAHAAEAGALPAALDAVRLPLPVDPVTGRPFAYEPRGGTAVLRGAPPADRAKEPPFNRVYELTLRK